MLPFLCCFRSDAEEEGELEPAKELIQPIAEKLVAKYKAKEEETPLLFFVAGEVRRAARGPETPFFSFFFPFTQNLREPECDYWTAALPTLLLLKRIMTQNRITQQFSRGQFV